MLNIKEEKLIEITLNPQGINALILERLDELLLEVQETRAEQDLIKKTQEQQWTLFSSTCDLINKIHGKGTRFPKCKE